MLVSPNFFTTERNTLVRQLISFIAAFIIATTVLYVVRAQAATATWETQENWTIIGDSTAQACVAIAHYENGRSLAILFADEEVSLVIAGVSVTPKQTYSVLVSASTGAAGILQFHATSANTIVVPVLDVNTIKALRNASDITIADLGGFALTGSKRAMDVAWECYQTLNSY